MERVVKCGSQRNESEFAFKGFRWNPSSQTGRVGPALREIQIGISSRDTMPIEESGWNRMKKMRMIYWDRHSDESRRAKVTRHWPAQARFLKGHSSLPHLLWEVWGYPRFQCSGLTHGWAVGGVSKWVGGGLDMWMGLEWLSECVLCKSKRGR